MIKQLHFAFLLAALALTACQTAHDAAVTTFRVVDAPHQYVRRKLGIDEEPQTTTTTTTTTQATYSDSSPYPPSEPPATSQPSGVHPPPPPVQTEHRVTTSQPEPPAERSTSTHVTRSSQETTAPPEPHPSATPHTVSAQSDSLPYAKPVPGKPGYVFSPYDPNGGYVDVKGYSPGQKVKDPYSGKVFLVP